MKTKPKKKPGRTFEGIPYEKFEQAEPMPGCRYPAANMERIVPEWFKKLPDHAGKK